MNTMSNAIGEAELRERAVVRLKKRAQFRSHVITYSLVNLWHVVIWAGFWVSTGASFFWPIFPAAVWGVFLALNWWDVTGGRTRSRRGRPRNKCVARSIRYAY